MARGRHGGERGGALRRPASEPSATGGVQRPGEHRAVLPEGEHHVDHPAGASPAGPVRAGPAVDSESRSLDYRAAVNLYVPDLSV
jgi:hypothetical protein